MKSNFYTLSMLSLAIGIFVSSCGPSEQLLLSKANAEQLQKDKDQTSMQLNDCNTQVKKLTDDKVLLEKDKAALINDNALAQEYLKDLTTASKLTIADQAKRLKTLQDMLQAQKNVMTKLKTSISEALNNYKADELYVYIKDGNVYVSMEEKLLFKSGSDKVDPKGKDALKTLAKVINSTKDINVMIEGHTDNVPIKTKEFEDNWDLSTARATSIVRILTNDYGFDSKRIIASGKGIYHPIKTNDTEKGRASNRRTEVIISPDLQEIYKLLYM